MKTKTNETIQTRIALPVTVAAALLVAALSTGNALFLGASGNINGQELIQKPPYLH